MSSAPSPSLWTQKDRETQTTLVSYKDNFLFFYVFTKIVLYTNIPDFSKCFIEERNASSIMHDNFPICKMSFIKHSSILHHNFQKKQYIQDCLPRKINCCNLMK